MVRAPIPSGLRGRSLRGLLDSDESMIGPRPIYAESLAARYRTGGPGVFTVASGGYRYVRGPREALFNLIQGTSASPPPDDPETTALRVTLDRLLEGHTIDLPADIAPADEDEYAALGYLGGGAVVSDDAAASDPDAEAALLEAHREAALLAGHKKYTAAIDRLRAIATSYPDRAVVHYQLGSLLARTGRLAEAQSAFRAAAALQPDNPYIPVAMAATAVRSARYADARDYVALAVALADHRDGRARAAAHEMAARVALARGDADAALMHAEATRKEDASRPLTHFVNGRLLYDEGRYDAALTAFEEAAKILETGERPFEDLHWYLGDTLAQLDRHQEAESHFREELRTFPRSIRTYASLAMLYRASNREQAVEDVIDELVDAAATPEGYATAARLWTILGDRERAATLTADARARFRGDPSLALFEIGR
jgi:tetratricopeptide (TPR) repeat protein